MSAKKIPPAPKWDLEPIFPGGSKSPQFKEHRDKEQPEAVFELDHRRIDGINITEQRRQCVIVSSITAGIDECFSYLVSMRYPVAVKVHAMEIIYQHVLLYPELKDELDRLSRKGSEGVEKHFHINIQAERMVKIYEEAIASAVPAPVRHITLCCFDSPGSFQ